MSEQKNSNLERTLNDLRSKLLSAFVIINVIGVVLFLLTKWNIIPVVIPIIYAVITILLYIYFLVQQLKVIASQIKDKIHWYEEILDSIPFPLSVTDNNRNWTFINRPVEKMLGVDRKSVV